MRGSGAWRRARVPGLRRRLGIWLGRMWRCCADRERWKKGRVLTIILLGCPDMAVEVPVAADDPAYLC
jgi:hypothetical protein